MLLQLAVLYVIVALASVVTPDRFLMRNPSTLILMVLAIFLTIFFENHIIERGARVYLVAIAVLITAWIVLRGAKYIAFEETEFIARKRLAAAIHIRLTSVLICRLLLLL